MALIFKCYKRKSGDKRASKKEASQPVPSKSFAVAAVRARLDSTVRKLEEAQAEVAMATKNLNELKPNELFQLSLGVRYGTKMVVPIATVNS